MTEVEIFRRLAFAADRLLMRADHEAARGRLNLAELWPEEAAALSHALYALDELDRAEAELARLRAKWAAE